MPSSPDPLPREMRVLVSREPGQYEVETRPVPELGRRDALLRIRACGVCSGELMTWYVAQKVPYVPGHEPAGEIVAVGQEVRGFAPGDRIVPHHHAPCGECPRCLRGQMVHCPAWRSSALDPGGMAEYVRVPAHNLEQDTLLLPDGVGFEDATLVEPLACVTKALERRVGLSATDSILVIGLGAMGSLAVALARHLGAAPIVGADRVPFRLDKALELGADAVIDVDREPLDAAIRRLTGNEGADVVFVAPPQAAALEAGLAAAAPGGRVAMFSPSPPGARLELNPHDLYFREVKLVPSYSCGPVDTKRALQIIADGFIRAASLVTHRFPLERAPEAYELASRIGPSLKVLVRMESG